MKAVALSLLLFSPSVFATGGAVGNGGDVVECRRSSANDFEGYYNLDFLVQFDSSDLPVASKDLTATLDRIERGLKAKLPEMLADFREFRSNLFNEKDFARKHIWTRAPFGLIDLKDEGLVSLVPENCRIGDQIRIVQAVIRQQPQQTGLPAGKLSYKFVPDVTDKLKSGRSLQLSFLLVHEWLWSFSNSAERNRRINYWLHSDRLENWSRREWIDNLKAIGLSVASIPAPASVPQLMIEQEANERLVANCEFRRERFNQLVVEKLASIRATPIGTLDFGQCVPFKYHGGKPGVELVFPNERAFEVKDVTGATVELNLVACKNSHRVEKRIEYHFFWQRREIFDGLGTLLGHEYSFNQGWPSGAPQDNYYWIQNSSTGRDLVSVRLDFE